MVYRFGHDYACTPWQSFAPARPPDPTKPDPVAVAEMEAFDLLPPEARVAVAESPNDVILAGKLAAVRQRGCPRDLLERIRERGLMPYQLGEAGILAELIAGEAAKAPDAAETP